MAEINANLELLRLDACHVEGQGQPYIEEEVLSCIWNVKDARELG